MADETFPDSDAPYDPVTGFNGGPIVGPQPTGGPLTALAAAALIDKEVG